MRSTKIIKFFSCGKFDWWAVRRQSEICRGAAIDGEDARVLSQHILIGKWFENLPSDGVIAVGYDCHCWKLYRYWISCKQIKCDTLSWDRLINCHYRYDRRCRYERRISALHNDWHIECFCYARVGNQFSLNGQGMRTEQIRILTDFKAECFRIKRVLNHPSIAVEFGVCDGATCIWSKPSNSLQTWSAWVSQ